jgi:hypothetical protein
VNNTFEWSECMLSVNVTVQRDALCSSRESVFKEKGGLGVEG